MKKLIALIVIALSATISTFAQTTDATYTSEDGAIIFDYPSEWTIEEQEIEFAVRYNFELWTPDPNPFASIDRSRIILEFVTRDERVRQRLSTPLEFAEYELLDYAEIDDVEESDEFDVEAVRIELDTGNSFPIVFYSLVLNDDWVVFGSISAPMDVLDNGEEALIAILDTIEMDVEATETPFERDLEPYDVSSIDLDETYESDDKSVSFDYPDSWEIFTDDTYTNFSVNTAYFVEFEQDDYDITIQVIDQTDPGINTSRDSDSPYEYLLQLRQYNEGTVTQFQVNEEDAVRLIIENDDEWLQLI
ncbi:MAG: hypothetical protein AAFV93_15975, partial [Chloroflexota bacterium]